MDRVVMLAGPAPNHDLIRLGEPFAPAAVEPVPAWVETALRRAPWVVVRRGYLRDAMLPVGVRGTARNERFATLLAVAEIACRLTPEDLADALHVISPTRGRAAPALVALAVVAPVLERRGLRWGPGGSVGFEIATGLPTVAASSDLDLIVRQDRRLEPGEASELLAALSAAAAPARIDVMLETPRGGVSLADLAATPGRVLVRTPDGPQLLADPWIVGAAALFEAAP